MIGPLPPGGPIVTVVLAEVVALHDIEDIDAFVGATLERSAIEFSESDREELHAEGLAILFELAAKFEPHRSGYDTPGRFSGYAAQMLPRRLGDAWHKRLGHVKVRDAEGKRRWTATQQPVSLDGLIANSTGTSSHEHGSARTEARIRPQAHWAPAPLAAAA